ncbi:hypothetical protein HMPREF0649_01234 [Segatella buccae D17]|nr:hypothetical protein HMPREF0649_01234 [Segatella buccae D17]
MVVRLSPSPAATLKTPYDKARFSVEKRAFWHFT